MIKTYYYDWTGNVGYLCFHSSHKNEIMTGLEMMVPVFPLQSSGMGLESCKSFKQMPCLDNLTGHSVQTCTECTEEWRE
jgi:hypothetical protein